MYSVKICSTEQNSAKLDNLVSEIRGSEIFRVLDEHCKTMMTDPDDWRTPLVRYLENPGHIANRKVWRQALNMPCLIKLFIAEL
jgi:hypothetical protein